MVGSDILISVTGGKMGGYLATPDKPNGGAVVILQEIFGINKNIRGIVDVFAQAGYLSYAPDLFWRQEPNVQIEPSDENPYERATVLMKGLDQPLALEDSRNAVKWLSSQAKVNGNVGVVGYCLGGKLAYQLAGSPEVNSIVVYHGTGLHTVLDQIDGFEGKALIHVACADHLCPPEAQKAIKEALSSDSRVDLMFHSGAGHGFARIGGEHYDEELATQANDATMKFLLSRLT